MNEALLEELKNTGHWHHRIDLGNGVFTADKNQPNPEVKWKLLEPYVPEDLTGCSVLDLGCNSGYHSVQMKKRGAKRVVSVDNYDDAIKQTKFLSKWFNVELEVIKSEAHLYTLTTEEQFDYILFLGLFYHLKYGVIVLDRLSEMTNKRLFFQSAAVGKKISKYEPAKNYNKDEQEKIINSKEFPKLYFIEKEYKNGPGNWWLPNDSAMISLLRSSGQKIVARPAKEFFVCEPVHKFGTLPTTKKLIFPKYGKIGYNSLVGQEL